MHKCDSGANVGLCVSCVVCGELFEAVKLELLTAVYCIASVRDCTVCFTVYSYSKLRQLYSLGHHPCAFLKVLINKKLFSLEL